ncbi:hypothetical protein ACLOJK_017430 [Asimina triloba]
MLLDRTGRGNGRGLLLRVAGDMAGSDEVLTPIVAADQKISGFWTAAAQNFMWLSEIDLRLPENGAVALDLKKTLLCRSR